MSLFCHNIKYIESTILLPQLCHLQPILTAYNTLLSTDNPLHDIQQQSDYQLFHNANKWCLMKHTLYTNADHVFVSWAYIRRDKLFRR